MKREDFRPDEGKQINDDSAIKGKNEEGTELRLLDPNTLDQPENGEGKSSPSNGITDEHNFILKILSK